MNFTIIGGLKFGFGVGIALMALKGVYVFVLYLASMLLLAF